MLDMTNGLLPGLQSFGLQSGYRWLIPAVSTSLMILEYLLAQHILHDTRQTHDLRETAATFGVALVKAPIRALTVGIVVVPFVLVYQYRLFDIPLNSAWAVVALFLGTEFFLLLASPRRAQHTLVVGDPCGPSFPHQAKSNRRHKARMDGVAFRQFPVFPANGVAWLSPVCRARHDGCQSWLSVLHSYPARTLARTP